MGDFKPLALVAGKEPGRKLLRSWGWPGKDIEDLYGNPKLILEGRPNMDNPEMHLLTDKDGMKHTLEVWEDSEGVLHSWRPDLVDSSKWFEKSRREPEQVSQ